MTQPTGYHDRHGIPIHVGDLIRVEHYRHIRGRRRMWLYFQVGTALQKVGRCQKLVPVVYNWCDIGRATYQCRLVDCGISTAEVLAESGLERNERGEVVTFNERLRKKKGSEA